MITILKFLSLIVIFIIDYFRCRHMFIIRSKEFITFTTLKEYFNYTFKDNLSVIFYLIIILALFVI